MDPNHKMWNAQQMELQQALEHTGDHRNAIDLFLDHHAMVHSANMAGTKLWSFEDEVVEGLAEADFRFIPNKEDHSIAWVLWHLARIEDVTMNMLVAGSPQILTTNNWLQKMEFNSSETGNALNNSEIVTTE